MQIDEELIRRSSEPGIRSSEPGEIEWTATIDGGTTIHEPDAEDQTGLLRDVLEAGKVKKLKEFTLKFNKLNIVYGVDLKTGEFIIGGLRADLAPEVPKCNLRLIYFMRRRGMIGPYQFTFSKKPENAPEVDSEGNKWNLCPDGEYWGWVNTTTSLTRETITWRYLLGWQTTCDGKNVQRIMFIDPQTGKFELGSKR